MSDLKHLPEIALADAAATTALGARLATAIVAAGETPLCITLHGELGAGKTTLTRGLLRGLGHAGRVPSPTYTLVEPYELAGRRIWHLDLYRLGDPAELEYLGLAEMTGPGSVLLIEWPERGGDFLPSANLDLKLNVVSDARTAAVTAVGTVGEALAAHL